MMYMLRFLFISVTVSLLLCFLIGQGFRFHAFCRCKDTLLFVVKAFLPNGFRVRGIEDRLQGTAIRR